MSADASSGRRIVARTRAAWRRVIRVDGNIESKLMLLAGAGAFLFVTLVATLFFVQYALVGAQQHIATTVVPAEQALGGLETAVGSAFERQAKIATTRSLDQLAPLRDRSRIENALSDTETLVEQSLPASDMRAIVDRVRAHSRGFLDADQALLVSVERKHQLRDSFENRLSRIDADLRGLIQSANALSGVLHFEHVIGLRGLVRQMREGPPSKEMVLSEVLGGARSQMDDVTDLVEGVIGLGWLSGKIGLALTEDALNTITANEIAQNRSQVERLLVSLARRAAPGSQAESRVKLLSDQFHAISPRISDEARPDSLIWLRRHTLAEFARGREILDDCARAARFLTGDVAMLNRASNEQADRTVRSSARTTRWSRWVSFLVSLFGLAMCVVAGIRIRDSVKALRETNRELADLRDNLELKVSNRTNELSASREQYRLLIETTKTIPFELGISDLRFRYLGPQAHTMLGVANAESLAPGFLEAHLHPDDRSKVLSALTATSGVTATQVDMELRLRRLDGGYTWVRLIASVAAATKATDDSGASPAASDEALLLRSASAKPPTSEGPIIDRTLRGVLFDVSHTHELEVQLRQAQKLESVGRLASGVAHEINTPVQFVSDNLHFLKEAFGDLTEVLKKYQSLRVAVVDGTAGIEMAEEITQAEEAADLLYVLESAPSALDRSIEGLGRIAEIVRSMKDFAHPDQKEMATIDLNQAITSTLTMARNEYKYVAEIETDLGELPMVTCHAGEVNQVFLNIIVNAAHAIGDVVQGSDNRGRITVTSRHEGPDVVVSIADTGGGIPDHVRDRIFDPFFTTKQVGKGTGQGLAIARSVVVDKHGGDIRVETEVGKGTTFIIRLPVEHRGEQMAA